MHAEADLRILSLTRAKKWVVRRYTLNLLDLTLPDIETNANSLVIALYLVETKLFNPKILVSLAYHTQQLCGVDISLFIKARGIAP
jgi:hypothetical protein